MKKTIINEYQLDLLVDIGVLYKSKDDTYHILLDQKVWGYACMPQSMVDDVAGKTIEVEPAGGEADRWVTVNGQEWYIHPWMLTEYYDRIKQWGKCKPLPYKSDGPGGKDRYRLQIISMTHLEDLVNNGIITRETLGSYGCIYKPVITDMGQVTMPDTMAEQMCGKTFDCIGFGTTWIEQETEHQWTISQWMLDRNYPYLLSRKKGCLDPGEFEDEEEEEKEGEDTPDTRNSVNIVGEIVEKTSDTIIVSTEYTDILVHYITGDLYKVGQRVSVEGHLIRTSNMMGYPEIKCTWIQEV